VVAENLRRLREDAGFRQDDLARRSRVVGLDWTASTVAAVETSRRAVGLDEALLLAIVLECKVAELFEGDVDVRMGTRAQVHLSTARQLVQGYGGDDVANFTTPNRSSADGTDLIGIWRRIWPSMKVGDIERVENGAAGEAERKAARKLGIDPIDVSVAAHRLWGQSLTEERDAQVSPESSPATRGHITRALLLQIEDYLERRGFLT
jgi:transcriptional regulator with XRE-family HTH domain